MRDFCGSELDALWKNTVTPAASKWIEDSQEGEWLGDDGLQRIADHLRAGT
jgi:hypothetical protein